MPSPPLVVANAVQVRLMFSINNAGAFNVVHARKGGATTVTQALANAVGSAIKSAWSTNIGPLAYPGTGLIRVGVRDLTAPNQPEYLDTGAIAAGTGTGDPLPANVASCVTLRTAMTGKSKRGRVYIGGFTEAQNDAAGNTATTAANAAVSFVQAVSAALLAQGLTFAILSRPSYAYVDNRSWTLPNGETEVDVIGRGNARSGGLEDVTLIQSRNAGWESQRRRTNGRGGAPTIFSPIASLEAARN